MLKKFIRAYPKYNLARGADYGCSFGDGSVGSMDQNKQYNDFAEFEGEFQECIFHSYFRNYENHRQGNEGDDKYFHSIIKAKD